MVDVFEENQTVPTNAGYRSLTPLNISMDTSSPIAFLQNSQEEWLDVDDLSPSLPDVGLKDVESMVLLGTIHQPRPQFSAHYDDEVSIPNEISYPTHCNMTQNTMEYISSVPPPLFNFSSDIFGDTALVNYDSAVESLSESSSLSGWSDSDSREINKQLYHDTLDSGFSSPFTYSVNSTDEGYDDHRDPTEICNIIGYNSTDLPKPEGPKRKMTAKPGLKRPKNGFIRFAMKFRKTVADEHPNLDNREISRILGVRWRKLSMTEKYAYEAEFHNEMAERKRSHPDWKYGGSRMTHELQPIEPIPSRLRPRETLKRRAIPRLTRPYRRRKIQSTEEAQRWVQCDRCNKWRKLPSAININLLPDKWFCEMNLSVDNDCSIPENISHEEESVEVYHFPEPMKQEIVETIPEDQNLNLHIL